MQFRLIDRSDDSQKQKLIDVFVNSIYVYDDKMLITYNYKDGEKCVDYDVIQQYMNKKENTDNHADYQCSPLKVIGEAREPPILVVIVIITFITITSTATVYAPSRRIKNMLVIEVIANE